MRNLRFVEFSETAANEGNRFFEIAAQVRELLHCEYAIIATAEADSLTVRAIAGASMTTSACFAVELVSKLQDRGPVVVDESRLVVVPITRDQQSIGLIIGYSSKPGTFNSDDLDKLTIYSRVVADMLDTTSPPVVAAGVSRSTFSNEELLHLSRLVTIGELSACFAHEVVNPLMLIRGHLRFIDETLASEDPLRISYEVIDRASRRIEDMAKRMLDFGKKRTTRLESCDIAEVISDTLRFVQPYFQKQFVDVQIRLDAGLPHLQLDRWHMVQALVNLLQNASDAMAECDRRVLIIEGRTDRDRLNLKVADTGTGINPADLQRIFDPFFTTKGDRGTGLGLYITKKVVEDHNGELRVETSNRGTTFVISLPL